MTARRRPGRAAPTRRRAAAVGVAASLLAIAGGVRTIDAAWSTSVTPDLDLAVVTPAIPEPLSRACVTQPAGLSVAKRAHFTWSTPSGGVVPTGYVIRVQNGASTQVIFGPSTATSADISVSSLQTLGNAAWLLTLLLGGPTATAPVTINAVYGDFESPNNFTHQLTGIALPSAGIGCSTFSGGSGLSAPVGGDLSLSVDTTTTVASTTSSTTAPPVTTVPATTTSTAPTTAPNPTSTTSPSTTTIAVTTTLSATTTTTTPATTSTTSTTPTTTLA
jgi:hypothetical protein